MLNRTEQEIMQDWKETADGLPAVSIKCLAYNHEKYIEDALNSFLMQKTNFPFEIVVHDDASTDQTAAIIRRYQEAYPHIMKPILETENQYSKGNGRLNQIVDARIRGKYVTLCEGDDYWTDEQKLQLQFDAMEKHPEIDLCAHTVCEVDARTGEIRGYIKPAEEDTILPVEKVIAGGGGFVGTNSLFYRREMIEHVLPFRKVYEVDYSLQVMGALRGGILYLERCMSKYRFMTEGSWSSKYTQEETVNKINVKWTAMVEQLDRDTEGKYHEIIETYLAFREVDRLLRFHHYRELKKYRNIYQKAEGKERKKFYFRLRFPRTYEILKKTRDTIRKAK